MRFCLACRSLSGNGSICSRCGRSFGGRLCQGKKKHLNPYDAQFCTHCGTNKLYDGASSIPFGWVSRVLIVAVVFFVGRWLLIWLTSAQSISFKALSGYHDIGMWFFETFGRFILFLLFLAFVSSLFPGDAGKWFRSTMFGIVGKVIALGFKVLEKLLMGSVHLLLNALSVAGDSDKSKS